MRHLIIGVIAFSILSLPTSSAFAYKLLGGKWPNNIVTSLYYYNFSSYSEVYTSAHDWSTQPIIPNLYRLSTPGEHYVSVQEISKWYKFWDAKTELFPRPEGPTYWGAEVTLNDYWISDYESNKKRFVIGHEFGHVLGLNHEPSLAKEALMYPFIEAYDWWDIYTPQPDDVAGVNEIYGAP